MMWRDRVACLIDTRYFIAGQFFQWQVFRLRDGAACIKDLNLYVQDMSQVGWFWEASSDMVSAIRLLLGVKARDRSVNLGGPNRDANTVRVSSRVRRASAHPDAVTLRGRACNEARAVEGEIIGCIQRKGGPLSVGGGRLRAGCVSKDALAHARRVDVGLLVRGVGAVEAERTVFTEGEGCDVRGGVAGGALGSQAGHDLALGRLEALQVDGGA